MLKNIVAKLLKVIGYKSSRFTKYNKKFKNYDIGDWTYGEPSVVLGRTHGKLYIGKYCSIGPSVELILANDHRMDFVSTYPFSVFYERYKNLKGYPKNRGDLIVGNDVWLCYGAKILSGVTIGDGAVIGMGAVVTKDVPPYAIVAGNPAKIIRYRFTDEIIKKMLVIKWWDWPHEDVLNVVPMLHSDKIEVFVEYVLKRKG